MERYVIRFTTSFINAPAKYFIEFVEGRNVPVIGEQPKIFYRKEDAEPAVSLLKEWEERVYGGGGIIIEVVKLPQELREKWNFNAFEVGVGQIRLSLKSLGYRRIRPYPVVENVALRRKITDTKYFVVSVVGNNAELHLENKDRSVLKSTNFKEDTLGDWRLLEAEDRMYQWAKDNKVF